MSDIKNSCNSCLSLIKKYRKHNLNVCEFCEHYFYKKCSCSGYILNEMKGGLKE